MKLIYFITTIITFYLPQEIRIFQGFDKRNKLLKLLALLANNIFKLIKLEKANCFSFIQESYFNTIKFYKKVN